jgi:uncharacterized protein
MTTASSSRLDTRGLIAFVAIAYGFAWACILAFVLGFGTDAAAAPVAFRVAAGASMLAPALATFIVTRWVSPLPSLKQDTGLRLGHHWGRFFLLALLGTPVVVFAALLLSVAFGVHSLDLAGLSAMRAQLEQIPGVMAVVEKMGLHTFLLLQVVQALVIGPLIGLPLFFGEEWGWRGYLLNRLLPLGQWPALIISGAIWGLWHAPVILLGYNYPQHRVLGILFFVVLCVLQGILLGWTRLATGSVWPAVLAHGSINSTAPLALMLGHADAPLDTAQVGLTGWPGWLLLAALVGVLVLTRQLPVRRPEENEEKHDSGGLPAQPSKA